jgi:hypothetical protein
MYRFIRTTVSIFRVCCHVTFTANVAHDPWRSRVNRIKQVFRGILLALAVILSAAMLTQHIREQFFLWPAREEGAGLHLLFEPQFRVFRLSPANGGKIIWHSSTGEPAEGSRVIVSMPAWPLAAVAVGVLIYAAVVTFDSDTWISRKSTKSNK